MKTLALFGLLIGFAVLNLIANFLVPLKLKLVILPAFALLVVIVLAKTLRRQP